MISRARLCRSRRWVIKVGSSLLTRNGHGLDTSLIRDWVRQIAALRSRGVEEVILVSSGAVAEGMTRLGWRQRPGTLHRLQAAAAVGQMGLIQTYESQFQSHGLHTAQVLLTHDDLGDRKRYLNARRTLQTLLRLGVVPIVNENDTVAADELRFGDNDTLAALVANLIVADVLVLLTDQPGMYDKDPRRHSDAVMIDQAGANDPRLERMAAGGGVGTLGRGGMLTKVRAARKAARSGAPTVIAHGREADILLQLHGGRACGTFIVPDQEPLAARKQWLANQLQVRGALYLDQGAVSKLTNAGCSLLAVGVTAVEGRFQRGDLVSCFSPDGCEVARGLVNYNADEADRIKGISSEDIATVLGYRDDEELIHRDNLVLL